ncbi:hypothetical protein Dimus_005421 [Dionaea muscipula]
MEKAAEIQGQSGSDDKFYDAKVEVEEPADVVVEVPAEKNAAGVDPSVPTSSLPDPLLQHFQAELDRARAERLQAELDSARAENARLQALLQQATSQSKS